MTTTGSMAGPVSRRLALAAFGAAALLRPGPARAAKGAICYLMPNSLYEFQAVTRQAIERSLTRMGFEVTSVDGENRADRQAEQFEDAIRRAPRAIIVNAVDAAAVIPAVDRARKAGIVVVALDRLIAGTVLDLTSVAATLDIGRIAADEAARLLKTRYGTVKGLVLQILGDPADGYTLEIRKGFEVAMKQYPEVAIDSQAAPQWQAQEAGRIAAEQLATRPGIDLIFVHAAHLAVAVVAVLEARGRKPGDVMLVSANGAPAGLRLIRQGWEQVEVEQPAYAEAYGVAMFMDRLVARQALAPGDYKVLNLPARLTLEAWGPNLAIPGAAITAANVNDGRFWGNLTPPTTPVEAVP
jgi:ribose transport system substrate-binding protein